MAFVANGQRLEGTVNSYAQICQQTLWMKQVPRGRTCVVNTFPDGNYPLILVCARMRYIVGTQWGNKKYMSMKHLEAREQDTSIAG